jgi:hypothetical protein
MVRYINSSTVGKDKDAGLDKIVMNPGHSEIKTGDFMAASSITLHGATFTCAKTSGGSDKGVVK